MTTIHLSGRRIKYPLSIRALHWLRAILIVGLIACGWFMVRNQDLVVGSDLYPTHKEFGVLVWLLALMHLALRWRHRAALPPAARALKAWENRLSHAIHRVIIVLVLLTPLLGYAMSSSIPDGDGVPFFFIRNVPELLPKSEQAFVVFQTLHKYSAYLLLACVVLHVAGALKHRFLDRNGATDVLSRML